MRRVKIIPSSVSHSFPCKFNFKWVVKGMKDFLFFFYYFIIFLFKDEILYICCLITLVNIYSYFFFGKLLKRSVNAFNTYLIVFLLFFFLDDKK